MREKSKRVKYNPDNTINISTHYSDYILSPGIIDDDAIGAFTTGQCHALAFWLEDDWKPQVPNWEVK